MNHKCYASVNDSLNVYVANVNVTLCENSEVFPFFRPWNANVSYAVRKFSKWDCEMTVKKPAVKK